MKKLPGSLALSVLTATTLQAFSQSIDLGIVDSAKVVLTPTRLRQPISEVPGSVTVIAADMLVRHGIKSVPEALRLVPGMAITQLYGGKYTINYHGSNSVSPRRMNVLIDGASVYGSAFAQVDWTMLPIAMEDIERIEVHRGPNSASYGPNSMLAIVNIITKHPADSAGTLVSASAGSRKTRAATARYGGRLGETTNYWLTVDHGQSAGFDEVRASGFTLPNVDPHHDSTRREMVSFRSSTQLSDDSTLEFRLAALNGHQDSALFEQRQRSFPDIGIQDRNIGASWHKSLSQLHELKVSAYLSRQSNDQNWIGCLPALVYLPELGVLWKANPRYALALMTGGAPPPGGTAADHLLAAKALRAVQSLGSRATTLACGTSNQNYVENRADIEMQMTGVVSDSLRLVAGAGARRDSAESATYLAGEVNNNTWRVFAHAEYRPSPAVVINAGGYFESDNLTGTSFSPRIAINKHLNASNTVRLVLSRANRMPSIMEQRANWSYLTTGLDPALLGVTEAYFAQSARATDRLGAEKNTSREIGYSGNFPARGLMVDVKLFDDRLTNLISEPLILANFYRTNSNSLRLRGAEMQVEYTPAPDWRIHTGYSYINANATTPLELTQYSRNSGMFAASHLFPGNVRVSLAAYRSQGAATGQSGFGKQDLTVSTRIRVRRSVLTRTLTVTHLEQTEVRFFHKIGKPTINRVGKHVQYMASLKATF